MLQHAHIASGSGVARRIVDDRAVILLCPLTHQLHVSNSEKHPSMHICGKEWPTIDERHTLWIKQYFDPDYYDRDLLQRVWIGKLPQPERPPQFWIEMILKNQGLVI